MKKARRILSVLMCALLLMGTMTVASFADSTGSITIKNPEGSTATVAGKTFELYKIFEVKTKGDAISYDWVMKDGVNLFYDFFFGTNTTEKPYPVTGESSGTINDALAYINSHDSAIQVSNMAEALHQYINDKPIAYVGTITAGTDATSVTFENLPLGYYMVYDASDLSGSTSAVRSAIMITNVHSDRTVSLKANRPQIEKTVLNNSNTFAKATSSDIGDVITFKLNTVVPSHTMYDTYKYSIVDTMDEGLVFANDTPNVTVKIGDVGSNDKTELKKGTDYTVSVDDHTITIDFDGIDAKTDNKYPVGKEIEVTYDAKLVGNSSYANQYTNAAELIYSNDPTAPDSTGSTASQAYVYTYQLELSKFAEDNKGNPTAERLAGAEFEISENGHKLAFDKVIINNIPVYVFVPASTESSTSTLEVYSGETIDNTIAGKTYKIEKGDILIWGLGEGEYVFTETKAPDGFVLPDEPFTITVTDIMGPSGALTSLDVVGSYTGTNVGSLHNVRSVYTDYMIWAEFNNQPGTALPETGGMGTALFTIIGLVLMAGAVAYMAMRKRRTA